MTDEDTLAPYQAALAEVQTMGRGLGGRLFQRSFELYREIQNGVSRDHVAVTRDVAYGDHERQVLDIHRPVDAGDRALPVVIFFHGGGFVGGNKTLLRGAFYGNVASFLARHGIMMVNANYRFAPEFQYPSGSEDVGSVVAWTRAHIAEHGGDPDRIVLSGHSSGATHAAGWALHKDLQPGDGGGIKGLILMSGQYGPRGPTDDERQLAYYGPDTDRYPSMSAIGNVGPAKFPVFLIYAEFDSAPFQSAGLALAAELTQRDDRSPWIRMIPHHNHMSEILSVDSGDVALGMEVAAFVRCVT